MTPILFSRRSWPAGRSTCSRTYLHRRMTLSRIRMASCGIRASANRNSAGSIPRPERSRNIRFPSTSPTSRPAFSACAPTRPAICGLANMYQATIVKFDRKAGSFQFWPLPSEQNIDAAQVNMASAQSSHVDGKVWAQNNGFAGVHRLDVATGKIETWEPFKNAPKGEPHNIYDVIPDSKNNAYFTDFRQQHIGRVDAVTGEVKLFEIPTARSAPRRGSMDAQDRLWFGEYRGDRIGMFDTRTEQFKEWKLGTRWASPYDVTLDRNEEAWTGSMVTDQVTRLNTGTGEMVDYLLPRSTNIRRVFVDNTTTPVTFWTGSNHGASIVKVEPLD